MGFGQWTYKFMEEIGWTQRAVVVFVVYVLGLISFQLGMKLQYEVRALTAKKIE